MPVGPGVVVGAGVVVLFLSGVGVGAAVVVVAFVVVGVGAAVVVVVVVAVVGAAVVESSVAADAQSNTDTTKTQVAMAFIEK